ncbi:MAG: DUF4430 domain-containing protein [Coriobacteriia bacterium]|nr:DUF4430 domain-containing protein [Coriobacteriia bacterium]
MKTTVKIATRIACAMVVLALGLLVVGCGSADDQGGVGKGPDGAVVGTGATSFTLEVVEPDKDVTTITVNTDAETVGEALVETGVAEGEDSDFGLFITTVNGTRLDYEGTGEYWAFYVNGEFAMESVDKTPVEDGAVYKMAVEHE